MCKQLDCGRPVFASGYCRSHHRRWKAGELDKPIRVDKYDENQTCLKDDCSKPVSHNFLCIGHIRNDDYVPYGMTGKCISSQGYVKVASNHESNPYSKAVLEHKLVMEKHLGRELFAGENVHHKNGDRTDNRIENLELWDRSQPPGQRVSDKITFYIEFLEQHGYVVSQRPEVDLPKSTLES